MLHESEHVKIVATNRKARHRYLIEDTCEAGLELKGAEVKSLRLGECSLEEAYARPVGNELYLVDMHIAPYEHATVEPPMPNRRRKLLMHRREISRVMVACTQRGYTLVPLKLYFKSGWAKVELGLARARPAGDKKQKKLEEQQRRDAARDLSSHKHARRE